MNLLETSKVECVRGDRPLVSGLSFSLRDGELLHIVGRNGSGKTTLLRTLCGLSRPNAGQIRWNSTDIHVLGDDYRALLAYVGHANGVQGDLTAAENLHVATRLDNGTDTLVKGALERMGLTRFAHLPTKVLSQGQRRRLALARLLVSKKNLWILDEPFAGLDADSVAVMEDILTDYLTRGCMVVVTSHQKIACGAKATQHITLDS
jgi:heme exporter protein A